jgi:hypothetical protein
MAALPALTDFTDSAVTEGQFKTAIGGLHGYLDGLFGSTGTALAAIAAMGLLGAGVSAKTGAYTILTTDRGKLITGSGTFTITLPGASSAGAGWIVAVANIGTGSVTVSGAETINGESSNVLGANQSLLLISTGSVWVALGGGSGRYAQEIFTSSGSAAVPSWANAALVTARAGGGGGGGSGLTMGQDGGIGGACVRQLVTGLTGGASVTVTIGAAGAAGTTSSGTAGGATSFGAHITLGGGSGGAGSSGTPSAGRAASGANVGAGLFAGSNGGTGRRYAFDGTSTHIFNASSGLAGSMVVEWIRV